MNPFTIEEQERMPEHVAIIMDGNGRWAQSKGKPRLFGHRNGVENVRSVVNTARELGIPYVTLYAFSQENQSRPVAEKSGLMKLLEEFLKIELKSMVQDGIRLRAIGDLNGLPEFARKIVLQTIEKTKQNEDWNLTLALNYGSRQEVLEAIKSISKSENLDPENLEWDDFSQHLQTWNETKSLMSMTPLKDRKQQVLTPAQQLEMRHAISKCSSLGEVIRVVDRYIFDKDHDGDVDEITPAVDRNFIR